jgi:hypothetical protein
MTPSTIIECPCRFERRGRRRVRSQVLPERARADRGRVPRLARLLALALRFEELIDAGQVRDFAELARLGHVSRARITQIMNLRLLAPDIQEQILFLPRTERGRDPLHLTLVQPVALEQDWSRQRALWAALLRRTPQKLLELPGHPR